MRCHKYSRSFGSIDRVDRWAVWRVLASLLPQTTLPQASPAAQLELDTRARRLSARAVWRQTLSWVPFGAAPPQVTRLAPPTIPSKPPRSSSPGTTMLGQSPLTRAHCGGGGARSLDRACGVWRLRTIWQRTFLGRAALERSDFAVRRLPLIFALK